MSKTHQICVSGTTKMGKRGQVVIPADIRREMKIKNGDHLLVFYKKSHFIGLIKADNLDQMLNKMTGQINQLKKLKNNMAK